MRKQKVVQFPETNTGLRKFTINHLVSINPMTENQNKVKAAFRKNSNLVLHGYAGTGKSYLSIAYALEQVLDPSESYKNLSIIRSIVPSRDIGFLKGDDKEKVEVYKAPYKLICEELFGSSIAYDSLEQHKQIRFIPTSFIRGVTLRDSIIVVDECQNMTFHELDSIITRIGDNCKIIFCGDYKQSDFTKDSDKAGLKKFLNILIKMREFTTIEFSSDDIVRSGLVKSYIITKTNEEV